MTDGQLLVFDGAAVKASISQLVQRPEAWTPVLTESTEPLKVYFRAVPWLFRGVMLRSNAVADMPFNIVTKAGDVYDTSEDWQNKVGFMPQPEELFWILEAALTLQPAAYLFRERTTRRTLALRYMLAQSIEPVIDQWKGLTGFTRRIGTQTIELDVEDLVYFWRLDPYTEYGPSADASPGQAACAASGVLFNVDEFASHFFERGAIKAQLLKVPAGTPDAEKKRAEAWWRRVFSGIGNAWSTKVVSEGTEVQQIGEGIGELSDSALSREKREDIAAALGIPMTLLWSTEAGGLGGGGVVTQDDINFYAKTIVPECQFIARTMTRQLFEPLGLRLVFRPETLDVFQEDETQRAQSFQMYVNAGIRLSVAAQMVGLELPEGMDYDDLDAQREEDKEAAAARMPDFGQRPPGNQPQGAAQQEAMRADLRRWRTKARKAGGPVPFESEFIPPALKASIDGAIAELGVEEAFAFLDGVKKKS